MRHVYLRHILLLKESRISPQDSITGASYAFDGPLNFDNVSVKFNLIWNNIARIIKVE